MSAHLFGEARHDLVRNNLEQLDAVIEDGRSSFCVSVQTFIHILQGHIFEAEYLRGVMICDKNTVHISYPCLKTTLIKKRLRRLVDFWDENRDMRTCTSRMQIG